MSERDIRLSHYHLRNLAPALRRRDIPVQKKFANLENMLASFSQQAISFQRLPFETRTKLLEDRDALVVHCTRYTTAEPTQFNNRTVYTRGLMILDISRAKKSEKFAFETFSSQADAEAVEVYEFRLDRKDTGREPSLQYLESCLIRLHAGVTRDEDNFIQPLAGPVYRNIHTIDGLSVDNISEQ